MQLAMTMAFIVWAPAFVMRAQGIQVEKAGVIVGAIGLLGILGAPLGGIAADLWQKKSPRGRIYVALLTVWLGAIMMALTILFELRGLGLVFGLFWGILAVAGTPAVNSISQDVVTPGIKGLSWGMAGFIAMLGGAAWAPSVVGAVSDSLGGGAYGLKAALIGITICGIVAGLMFLLASRHYPQDLETVKGLHLEAEK
jgi:MFS family permease